MAMMHMASEGVYVVESANYNSDKNACELEFECVTATFEQAKEWINAQSAIEEYAMDVPRWNRVSKWIKDLNERYSEVCTYTFVGNEVYFVDISDEYADRQGLKSEWNCEINIEVPFKSGDIVEINGLPYCERYHALITNVGDNRDCCCLQALFRRKDGKWEVGSVKHNQLLYNIYPFVSPLYIAEVFAGTLLDGEELMYEVQKYIDGDEQRGTTLWNYVSYKPITDRELVNFLEKKGYIR